MARIIVSVSSLERSLPFYRALGFETFWSNADVARLRSRTGGNEGTGRPGSGVELMLHERGAEGSDLGVAVSFVVDDVDALAAAGASAGGSIVDPPEDQPWGERQAVLHDPDGHVVCLVAPLS